MTGVICSGGASAGNDLLLHLIRRFASNELAAECGKKTIDQIPIVVNQAPYVMQGFCQKPPR